MEALKGRALVAFSAVALCGLLAFGSLAGIGAVRRSSWFKPYEKGKTNFRYTYQRSGVYLIRRGSRVVYVGFSRSNVYKTMARHFQRWNHPYQDVVTYPQTGAGVTVRVLLCSPSQASRLEKYLIQKYQPVDNVKSKDIETAALVVSPTDPIIEALRNAEPLPF